MTSVSYASFASLMELNCPSIPKTATKKFIHAIVKADELDKPAFIGMSPEMEILYPEFGIHPCLLSTFSAITK